MSLTSSLANAFSGLTVTSRAAQLVSSNLANALNENYSVQEIEIGSTQQGGSTTIEAKRFTDRALTADMRNALADRSLASGQADGARALEQIIGSVDDPSSIPGQLNRFDAALRYLESDPSSDVRLKDVVAVAKALATKLNEAEAGIQTQRMRADKQIATEIETLNSNLQQVVSLNEKILSAQANGRDVNFLLDQRSSIVNEISELVPVREMRRDNNAISLVTASGMMLVEASAKNFEFAQTNQIMPHMTANNGHLGSLTSGTDTIDAASDAGPMSGGRLQSLFDLRDQIAPDAQSQLDAFALDLATRFHNLPSDINSTPTAPGLFTDNGARSETSNVVGMAGRLKINASVDPASGGEVWRIRSGAQATTPTAAGDANLITNMIASLSQSNLSSGSIFEGAADLSSQANQRLANFEQTQGFANAAHQQLLQMHLSNGVNTDAELQKLLIIETNYAANAKVMQTIDEMFAAILRIN